MRRIDVAMNPEIEISESQLARFQKAILRLKDHEPVQYITGKSEFYGREFLVNKNVLIPRPETEELVDWIISDHKKANHKLRILDIGTGSGCIPVTLALELSGSKVTSIDISDEAIIQASRNAELNNSKVNFLKKDILAENSLDSEFDIIVSNPPYVRDLEKKEMQRNVLDFEPEAALYVRDENALIFYEKISSLAGTALKDKGVLYFEINQFLAEETKNLVENFGFEAELKKDIFGNYRMLKAVKI
ncbi:peptide chain release factor N(5)-glutamine methyltransferase [Christiangramia lutea]|uniref:peptide chain release factor N(5)-glutamine methyltransferase n=1 Tax=Christiangramia lutea TaxID=1607951 RepID=UPI00311A93AE